jgi:NAD(P)-dependent dehydrogenase (short-subunit alcohol dehydrogenase family)
VAITGGARGIGLATAKAFAAEGARVVSATKFGVIGLTQALRQELRPRGVRVSVVLPGVVHTELSAGLRLPAVVERFVSVQPGDIAAAVVSLARRDRAAAYVPGRLRPVLRTMLALPERPRRMLGRLSRTEEVFLAVDQSTRDAYHGRAMT